MADVTGNSSLTEILGGQVADVAGIWDSSRYSLS